MIIYDGTAQVAQSGITGFTWTQAIVKGQHRMLVVGIGSETMSTGSTTNVPVTACTFNGVSLTKITSVNYQGVGSDTNEQNAEMWVLYNPPVGSYTMSVTFAGSVAATAISANFHNVMPVVQVSTTNTNTGGATSLTGTVTTTTPNTLIVDWFQVNSLSSGSITSNRTQISTTSITNPEQKGAMSYFLASSTGSQAMTQTCSSVTEGISMVVAAWQFQSPNGGAVLGAFL